MITISSVREMQGVARAYRRRGERIGFVPTMGALHEGHLSLVRRTKALSDVCVVSIFVNPTQFGQEEDYARYPRDLERDRQRCAQEEVDVVFAPQAVEIYPPGHSVFVGENDLSRVLCGAVRPGHFQGVLTVVAVLLNAVLPDVLLLGQKDAQQALLVQRMVRDLCFPVQVVVGQTVRENDGLAMSSRNAYLTGEERKRAPCLYAALQEVERMYGEGERDARLLAEAAEAHIRAALAPVRFAIDFITVVDPATLRPLSEVRGTALVALAVTIGAARLIDNTILPPGGELVT